MTVHELDDYVLMDSMAIRISYQLSESLLATCHCATFSCESDVRLLMF